MFEGLTSQQIPAAIEAMLFVTDEPLPITSIAEMLEVSTKEAQQGIETLQKKYVENHGGIQLREVAAGWRLYTNPEFHGLIEKYVISWDTRRLSQAALEVLAVVAYSQPVTRQGIAAVRGVNSDSSLNSLVEKGLVKEMGTADTPGNPMLYGTTTVFLEKFGLKSVKDLPELAYFAPDEETKRLIEERLSATKLDAFGIEEESAEESIDDLSFDFTGETLEQASDEAFSMAAAQDMLKEALASSLGVTEKIDFDALVFESDDE